MIDIQSYWGPPDKLTLPIAKTPTFQIGRLDDDCMAALGICLPKPKPILPKTAAAKELPKEESLPCHVATTTLKRGDRIRLLVGKPDLRVAVVTGDVVHLDLGLAINTNEVPMILCTHRSIDGQPEPDTRKLKFEAWKERQTFLKATEPKCPPAPLPTPKPIPTPTPASEMPTQKPTSLEDAAEIMVGGRPAPKGLPSNVTLFMPGEPVPMNADSTDGPKPNRFKVKSYEEMKDAVGEEGADRWAELNKPLVEFLRSVRP